MKKTYTFPIPDELYVDKFDQNLKYQGTYDGPEKIYLLVQPGEPVGIWSDKPFDIEFDKVNLIEVELNAADFPEVADYITGVTKEYTYTFKPITNIDGSVYNEISNPRLNDYYKLYYSGGTKNWDFRVITRDLSFQDEEKVKKDLEYVKSYKDKYDFGADNAAIDSYIANAESYITTVEPLYPWRFENPLVSPLPPKIPVSLIKLFKSVEV